MRNVTVQIPDELEKGMEVFKEVNWSEVCRNGIERYLFTRSIRGLENAREVLNKKKEDSFKKGFEIVVSNIDKISLRTIEKIGGLNSQYIHEDTFKRLLGEISGHDMQILCIGCTRVDENNEFVDYHVAVDTEYLKGVVEAVKELNGQKK
jgi:hypothetical protein